MQNDQKYTPTPPCRIAALIMTIEIPHSTANDKSPLNISFAFISSFCLSLFFLRLRRLGSPLPLVETSSLRDFGLRFDPYLQNKFQNPTQGGALKFAPLLDVFRTMDWRQIKAELGYSSLNGNLVRL